MLKATKPHLRYSIVIQSISYETGMANSFISKVRNFEGGVFFRGRVSIRRNMVKGSVILVI